VLLALPRVLEALGEAGGCCSEWVIMDCERLKEERKMEVWR
jgi:hypothetical protein